LGDPAWGDYELTLEARKTGGGEGFLILFRARDSESFYWWNLGGWGNQQHALECEVDDQRRIITKRIPGKIETGRWYTIRVRVEGDHIQGWLDGEKLLDTRDGSHPTGAVGVGTWRTRALFRSLRVTSLEGKTLWEGLPELEGQGGTALYWDAHAKSGELAWALDSVNALNCRVSQRLDIGLREGSAHGGLTQERVAVERGREYRGSLWLRGEDFEGVGVVGLSAPDGTPLATAALPDPGKEWTEASFTLRPTATDANAALVIAFAGSGRVWVDQVSLMSKAARRASGFRPDLLRAIRDLHPPMIRWPGGCFASIYRWKDGIGPRHERVSFIRLCRRVGAEPLIVVNSGSWDDITKPEYLQDALDWLEYCNGAPDSKWGAVRARNGHREPYNVRYWEIDNETWRLGVETYAEVVKRFAPAMRDKDPGVILFACGSGGRNQEWNKRLVELCGECFEYISPHHYERPDGYATGARQLEAAWADLADFIRKSEHPDIKIAFTEWNLQTTDWRTGLFAGGFLIAAERQAPTLGMASPALFLRNVDAPAWDNAFINFDHAGWFPAPNYVVMRMFRRCYAPVRIALDGEIPAALDALATRSEDGRRLYVKLFNPTDRPVTFAVGIAGKWRPDEAQLRWVAAESLTARNTLDEPNTICERRREVRARRRTEVHLPAASVAVLCLRQSGAAVGRARLGD
jgi:alpha-N-arabinofuranosidase